MTSAEATRKGRILSTASMVLALAGCGSDAASLTRELANPGSQYCAAQGGRLMIETAPSGQYGVCVFEDNRQCEARAMLGGACPVGGIKVTGHITPEARYCAIRGGDYAAPWEPTATTPEAGTCTLPGEPACDALALYEGRCPSCRDLAGDDLAILSNLNQLDHCLRTPKLKASVAKTTDLLERSHITLLPAAPDLGLGTALASVLGVIINEGDFSSAAAAAATGAAALSALPSQRSFAIIEAIPGVIIGYPARVHEYPDSESRVIKQVQQSDKVTVIIIHGDWYGVILLDNTLGYVFRDLVDLESNSEQEQEATEVERSLANLPQEPLAAVPHSTEPRTKPTTKSATELQSAPTDLRTTIDEMAGNIAEQQPEFRSSAFQCRSDLRQCRMDFAYLDCELSMIACLIGAFIGGN